MPGCATAGSLPRGNGCDETTGFCWQSSWLQVPSARRPRLRSRPPSRTRSSNASSPARSVTASTAKACARTSTTRASPGKPSEYLYNQLIGFREKRRSSPVMTYMVGGLSDSYLGEIADYYAALRPPFPPPAPRADAGQARARRAARAEGRSGAATFRRAPRATARTLTGMLPGIPGLVGLYPDYIGAQMGAWKNGVRNSGGCPTAWRASRRACPATTSRRSPHGSRRSRRRPTRRRPRPDR